MGIPHTVKCLKQTPHHIQPDGIMKWYQLSVQNIRKHEFAFIKSRVKTLIKNSEENDSESDGDTNIDNDGHNRFIITNNTVMGLS